VEQRSEDRVVDLPQSADACAGAKRIEDANVGGALAVAQSCEIPPRPLLGQQLGQQVEGMYRRQQCQQVRAPELGWTELPARTTQRPHVAVVVDEVVGNVWIKQVEQLVGASDRKAFHGARGYRF
jgi:hypothetical protein